MNAQVEIGAALLISSISYLQNILLWFLGVIDSISADTINIRYYNRRDKKGQCWTFPDDDCILLETIKYLEASLFPICKPV